MLMNVEEHVKYLFNSLPVPCVVLKLGSGEIMEANEAFISEFVPHGVSVVGKTTLDLKMWNSVEDRAALMSDLINGKEIVRKTVALNKRDGTSGRYIISAKSVDNKFYLASLANITEIENQKAQYQKLLNKHQNIIALTGSAYVILDDRFLIQECSETMGKIVGHDHLEIIGENFFKFIPDSEAKTKSNLTGKITNLLLDPSTDSMISGEEICLKCSDGTCKWLSVSAGSFGYNKVVCFLNGIEARKKMEHSKFIVAEKNKDKLRQRLNRFQQDVRTIVDKARKG